MSDLVTFACPLAVLLLMLVTCYVGLGVARERPHREARVARVRRRHGVAAPDSGRR